MKNIMKKLMCLGLSLLLSASMFVMVGCNRETSGQSEELDINKTQLYIANQNFGFGHTWLDKAEVEFEEKFADYEFEPGKKGVQIFTDNGGGYGSNTLLQSINAGSVSADIFFCENSNYFDYMNGGAMLDITDIVTEPLTEYGESESISDKLTQCYDEYLHTDDGKYFALPNYECSYWLTYNINFFEENNLYFAQDGSFVSDGTDKSLRSEGPDGIQGNYDDGLPATFDQFFELCQRISDDTSGTPIAWPGGIDSYRNVYLSQLHASIEGRDQYMIGYNFEGEANSLVKGFDDAGYPILESKSINPSNAYEVYRQAGRYWAINFFERIIENGYCSQGSLGSDDHLTCQADFIESAFLGSPVAILFDGNYWTNEADDAFNQAVINYGESASKDNVRFGVMPMPRPHGAREGKNAILMGGNDLAFICSKTPENRIPVAKKFLQFLYTDVQLKDYTRIVGSFRGCDIDFTEDEKSTLPEYVRSMIDYRNESELMVPCSHSPVYTNNGSDFISFKNGFQSILMTTYNDPIMYLREKGNLREVDCAREYFEGYSNYYTSSYWKKGYSKWF